MGKRNSISVRSDTYDKVKSYCARNGCTASGLIEKLIAEALKNFEIPVVARSPESLAADKIFTF